MPRKKTKKNYFDIEQEEAVVAFLSTDDHDERTRIYDKSLRGPLSKMADSIIRRYGLHRKGIEYREIHDDALSYLIMKADKFKPEQGKKAYSYYGTIIKNHLLGLLKTDTKKLKRNLNYDDYKVTLEQDVEKSYIIDEDNSRLEAFINEIRVEIDEILENNRLGLLTKKLTENEKKVGYSLIYVLENWETIFEDSSNKKYNKNNFYAYVREYTGLKTKDIRNAMNRYKKLYFIMKVSHIDE